MFDLHGWEWAYVRAGTLGEPRSYAYNGLSDGHRLPGDYVRKCLRETTIKYSLPAIDPDGPQGTLFLEPGLPESPAAVGLKYLRYKYFKPQALPQFIESAVRFEFQPLPAR